MRWSNRDLEIHGEILKFFFVYKWVPLDTRVDQVKKRMHQIVAALMDFNKL